MVFRLSGSPPCVSILVFHCYVVLIMANKFSSSSSIVMQINHFAVLTALNRTLETGVVVY